MGTEAEVPDTVVEREPLELAVVILNYRTPGLVRSCLESFVPELSLGREIAVVVDNDSGDGSAERIASFVAKRDWTDRVRIECSPTNGGFSAGMNRGMRAVAASSYLLLNSDCRLEPGTIAELRGALEAHPKIDAVGPRICDAVGNPTTSAFRFKSPMSEFIDASHFGPVTRLLRRFDVPIPPSETPHEPDWISFACILIRASTFERVGPMDEGYFLYFEDLDYGRRIAEAGGRVLHWPAARVIHDEGGSTGVADTTEALARRPRYVYEARARYFAKHYGRTGLWFANLCWTAGWGLALVRCAFGKRRSWCRREALDIWTRALCPLQDRAST